MKGLLKSKTTLYVVAFLSVTNVLSYLMNGNWNAVVMFAIVGLVTTYFTKNMIVVLASALLVTNALISLNYLKGVREGLENPEKDKPKDKENEEGVRMEKDKPSNNPSKESDNADTKPEIDYATTISEAYDNLDKLIGKEGVQTMADHTKELAEKQKELMKNLENMQPIMMQAGEMLKNLNLSDSKLENIFGGIANQLKGSPIH
jgi:hypothetical protein